MSQTVEQNKSRWPLLFRGLVALLSFIAVIVTFVSARFLTQRFTETTRLQAEVRLALSAASFENDLRQSAVVPRFLAQDAELIHALETNDFSLSTQHLFSFVDDIGAASLRLLDENGRVVASTDRHLIGEDQSRSGYFEAVKHSSDTVFQVLDKDEGFAFLYAHAIQSVSGFIGAVVVDVDVRKMERQWSSLFDIAFLKDETGKVLLSSVPLWRGMLEDDALRLSERSGTLGRAFQEVTLQWRMGEYDTYLDGDAVLRREVQLSGGWTMVSFTGYTSVRERVLGIVALELAGFALLLLLIFGIYTRKARFRLERFESESFQLRTLNNRLQREVSERQKAEKNLEVVGQTLAQSSKLAVLGEMSASVSHELNQPLAAMKTYLAGARLLLQRDRFDEALGAFQRIDDLIDRMGAITKQLKSHARKGSDAFEKVDVRHSVSMALAMMEPQLKAREVDIVRMLPNEEIFIFADRLRFEQVLVNLIRNALDATKAVDDPTVEILLARGDAIRLSVRDNGLGISDIDELFEPFYTTKQSGDGVGLGLAISSGIVKDFGGHLSARNAPTGGAVFELELPLWKDEL